MIATTDSHNGYNFDRQVLALLFQHRLVTSEQLRELLGPFKNANWANKRLAGLHSKGLIDYVTKPVFGGGRPRIWFLTEAGREVAGEFKELRNMSSPPLKLDADRALLNSEHTLDVVRTHVEFVRDARRRGDEYGPRDWVPEVYHRLSEARRDALMPDAVMRYTATTDEGRVHLRAFVELDRCTEVSEQLTSKLTAYARFYELTPIPLRLRGTTEAQGAPPAWQDFYPLFPRLLFVLANGSETTMRNRIEDLQLAAGDNARVVNLLRNVPAGAATLRDIEEYGPSAPVWSPLADAERPRCGWADL
ncbi:replication-relaxation family protein [Kitasatospora aureofaciens]|uniref:replication-relaxation family protein n=1 Tax=Kitasatospora aureofaciens TaxID=1894 RepID=UPI00340738E3